MRMPRLVGKPKTPIMLKIPVVMRINVDFILESFGVKFVLGSVGLYLIFMEFQKSGDDLRTLIRRWSYHWSRHWMGSCRRSFAAEEEREPSITVDDARKWCCRVHVGSHHLCLTFSIDNGIGLDERYR